MRKKSSNVTNPAQTSFQLEFWTPSMRRNKAAQLTIVIPVGFLNHFPHFLVADVLPKLRNYALQLAECDSAMGIRIEQCKHLGNLLSGIAFRLQAPARLICRLARERCCVMGSIDTIFPVIRSTNSSKSMVPDSSLSLHAKNTQCGVIISQVRHHGLHVCNHLANLCLFNREPQCSHSSLQLLRVNVTCKQKRITRGLTHMCR
jgi:hypothetical protein